MSDKIQIIYSKKEGKLLISDDYIVKGDLCYDPFDDVLGECLRTHPESYYNKYCKKVWESNYNPDHNGECLNCDENAANCKCVKSIKS